MSKAIVPMCVFLLLPWGAVGQKLPPGHRPASTPPVEVPADLDLPKAEQILFERNLNIIVNRYQLDAAQAARLIAGYKPNPFIQLGMEQVAIHSPIPGSYPRFVTTSPDAGANPVYTAELNKTFERGGKREARIEQADKTIEAARAQIDDTFRTQLFNLRQAFASALLARDDLQLAQSLDENYQRVQDLTETRVRTGALAQIELFRVRSGRLPYAQAILDARNTYEQSVQDILNLLSARPPDAPSISSQVTYNQPGGTPGQPAANAAAPAVPSPQEVTVLRAGPTVNLQGSFTETPISQTLAEARDLALRERPDVVEARDNLQAAEAATKLAQAQRHRDLSVGVEYQRVGDDDSLGIVAQVPLFLYNNQKAGITQAVAQEHATEIALHQTELQAVTDVQKAYQAYLGARQSLDLYQKGGNLDQVQKLVDTADFSYRQGATSLFELLDAQRTLRQTQTAYNQARQNYQLAVWQLEEAVGKPLLKP